MCSTTQKNTMAFESRRGGRYYYRKRRIGNRVISEYIGGGELAGYLSEADQEDRIRRRIERQIEREIRAESEKIDRKIDEIGERNRNLVEALYLINGYYRHKGQWRKKRDEKSG